MSVDPARQAAEYTDAFHACAASPLRDVVRSLACQAACTAALEALSEEESAIWVQTALIWNKVIA
jgi:hypothetical protein